MLAKLALRLAAGIILGFALQRGRFRMYTAFRDIYPIKDLTLCRAYLLAGLIQMVLIQLLRDSGVTTFGPDRFYWHGAATGGFLCRSSDH